MALFHILAMWAALFGAAYPSPATAQEVVERGNSRYPHQPPAWVLHLARPETPQYPEAIQIAVPDLQTIIGKPHLVTSKKACRVTDENGNKKWTFCEL